MKIKRIIAGISAVCLMGAVLPTVEQASGNVSITVSASDEAGDTKGTYGVLTYIKFENYIYISDCDKSATEVVIPAEIDGLPVTSIEGNAFYKCSALTSVVIPDSVTFIGCSAFSECSSLTSIIIPDSVEDIGMSAFSGCSSLTLVTISEGVTAIGGNAFEGCESLTSIKILNPKSLIYDASNQDYEKTIGDTVTIYGYDNSTAQTYAENFGNEFVSLDKALTTGGELEVTLIGDANCDGQVTIADATTIIQYLGNSDEYALSEKGEINADCYNTGDGVIGKDASAIQMIEAGLIYSLPVKE